jgi:hypothetical protein
VAGSLVDDAAAAATAVAAASERASVPLCSRTDQTGSVASVIGVKILTSFSNELWVRGRAE